MNLRELPQDGSATYALEHKRPLSLHLPTGARVRALSGAVWLTQDGLTDDVVLAPGQRFEAKRKAHVVMNALAERACVYVEPSAETAPARFAITPELIAAMEAKARRLRQEEFSRLLNLACDWIVRKIKAATRKPHRRSSTALGI